MNKTYAQILEQIDSLRIEAESVRQKEIQGVIDRIRKAIDSYGLTAEDLGFGTRGTKPRSSGRVSRVAKYRDAQGNEWSGRGPRPKWLRDAIAAGGKKEDFAVRN